MDLNAAWLARQDQPTLDTASALAAACTAYARVLVSNYPAGERQDLAQGIVAAALASLDSFRGRSLFSTWLASIARNHLAGVHRKKAGKPKVDQYMPSDETRVAFAAPLARPERDTVYLSLSVAAAGAI